MSMTAENTTAESSDAPDVGADSKSQYEPVQGRPLEVKVDERGVERAIRKLRRLMASEGVLREIKRRRHYEKPSVKSKRKLREAERRRKRRERKKTMGER
jgi:small subunit ribosomal protein S21